MSNQSTGSASHASARFARLSVSFENFLGSLHEISGWGLAQVSVMRGVVLFASVLVMVGASCIPASAQVTLTPSWNQLSPASNPGGRFQSSLTYDAAHGQVVLFSGNDEPNDTWLWN